MFIMFAITDAYWKKNKFSSFCGFYRTKDGKLLYYDELCNHQIEQEKYNKSLFKEFSHWQHKFRI